MEQRGLLKRLSDNVQKMYETGFEQGYLLAISEILRGQGMGFWSFQVETCVLSS